MTKEPPIKHCQAKDVIREFAFLDIDSRTVGYGERYPRTDDENLVIDMTNNALGFHHQNREAEVGYDLTHIGKHWVGVEKFIKILSVGGLDPIEDFVRIYRDLGRNCSTDYGDHYRFAWVNDDGMFASTSNPITGEPGTPGVSKKQGYAGYIGIGGSTEFVDRVSTRLDETAHFIKDKRTDGLFY